MLNLIIFALFIQFITFYGLQHCIAVQLSLAQKWTRIYWLPTCEHIPRGLNLKTELFMTLNIKEFNPPLTQSWISMYSSKHCTSAQLRCCVSTALLFNSLFTVSLTFIPADEVDLRRVTYEAMLEDWFCLSEEPEAPVVKADKHKNIF